MWLRTSDDLRIYTFPPVSQTVWIATADVFKYAIQTKGRIRENLDRADTLEQNLDEAAKVRLKYRYLLPERTEVQDYAKDLAELKGKYPAFDYRIISNDLNNGPVGLRVD